MITTRITRSRARILRETFPFLQLPPELRNEIYRLMPVDNPQITSMSSYCMKSLVPPSLARVNKQIRSECLPVFYSQNSFSIHAAIKVYPEPVDVEAQQLARLCDHLKGGLGFFQQLSIRIFNSSSVNRYFMIEVVRKDKFPGVCRHIIGTTYLDWSDHDLVVDKIMNMVIVQKYHPPFERNLTTEEKSIADYVQTIAQYYDTETCCLVLRRAKEKEIPPEPRWNPDGTLEEWEEILCRRSLIRREEKMEQRKREQRRKRESRRGPKSGV
ncbi:hypothetical protein GGR54DRAFT_248305 [Hypoxylon sp. NC1633]|nr:hypothetical protein GGR54DRAFT_248305 [Hypoxylon sp. NC1633]